MTKYLLRPLFLCCLLLTLASLSRAQFVLVSSTPTNGATGISGLTSIQLRFSAAVMQPLAGPIQVTPLETASGPVAGSTTVNNDTITFTPSFALPPGLTSVNFSSVLSATGLPIQSATTSIQFTVGMGGGGGGDTTPPSLVSSTPAASATGVSINLSSLNLTFSEAMDHTRGDVTLSGPSGTVMLTKTSISGATLSYSVQGPLAYGTTYTVNCGNVFDLAGNPPTIPSFTFTTQAITPLTLQSSTPASGATGVARTTAITLRFNKAINVGASTVAVSDGATPFTRSRTRVRSRAAVAGTLATGATAQDIVFTPTTPLQFSTTYSVDFSGVQDTDGLTPTGITSLAFTTTFDPTPPTLTASTPTASTTNVDVNLSAVTLTFTKPMDQALSVVTLMGPGGAVALTRTSTTGATLTYQPTTALQHGAVYTVDYSGARDINGVMVGGTGSYTFTTISAQPLVLHSATPSSGATRVAARLPSLSLVFSNLLQATSTITLQGGGSPVPVSIIVNGNTLTAVPQSTLRFNTLYVVNLAGVRDTQNQTPVGSNVTFTTEAGIATGGVLGGTLRLEPNVPAGITYQLHNGTSVPAVMQSANAEFHINNAVAATVAAPLSVNLPAYGDAVLPTTVMVDPVLRNAAIAASTDEIVLRRTFTDAGGSTLTVTVPLTITLGSVQAAVATVTDIVLDRPQVRTTVSQHEELHPHALIHGTGNGSVVGTWYVDDTPLETFQLAMTAGQSLDVETRRSVPTQNLGLHTVTLRVTQPTVVASNTGSYLVFPRQFTTHRVALLGPGADAALAPDTVRVSYRWLPVPDAVGYEIAFADAPDALGLDAVGNLLPDRRRTPWTPEETQRGRLLLVTRVASSVTTWKPNTREYARLFAGNRREVYWAVRAIFSTGVHGDPATTSRGLRAVLLPMPAPLRLLEPTRVIDTRTPTLRWDGGPALVHYTVTVMRNDQVVFTALTDEPFFAFHAYMDFQLVPGRYTWQVTASKTGAGMIASSPVGSFTVKPAVKRAPKLATREVAPQSRVLLAANALVEGPSTNGITFSPADGATVNSAQPRILVSFPTVEGQTLQLLLDEVDVTSIAESTTSSLALTPPQPLSAGRHTVTLVTAATDGAKVESTAAFTVAEAQGGKGLGLAPEGPTFNRKTLLPVDLQFHSNWSGGNQTASQSDVSLDTILRGEPRLDIAPGAYSTLNFQLSRPNESDLEVSSLITEAGAGSGRFTARLGDVGVSEGSYSISGLSSRAFSVAADTGPMKFVATRSIGDPLGRKVFAPAPEVLVLSAEPTQLSNGRTIKMVYVSSKQKAADYSGFSGATTAKVVSLVGQAPIKTTGFNLQGEVAKSDGSQSTGFGEVITNGLAYSAGINGQLYATNLAVNFRRIDADFSSPASMLLSHDLQGWDLRLDRNLGQFLNASLCCNRLTNASGGESPASENNGATLNLALNVPKWPSLTLGVSRNSAKSDPAYAGGTPTKTTDNNWNAGLNYSLAKVNLNVNYSRALSDDAYDVIDPTTDTPRDRKNGTWSCGLSCQPLAALSLRADWGRNDADYYFRSFDTNTLANGRDTGKTLRLEGQWTPLPPLSLNLGWSRDTSRSATIADPNGRQDFDARLNYAIMKNFLGQHQFTLSSGWRKTHNDGTTLVNAPGEFTIQLADTLAFSL
jgi:methionine-rich copper-binding protein CopC